jgi:hypothetical protein
MNKNFRKLMAFSAKYFLSMPRVVWNFARQRWMNLQFREWSVPLGLLAVCAAAYLPWLAQLGLYWDDWTQLLVPRLYDLSHYWEYFSFDRPFSAWTHILFVPLLGYKPLHWHWLSFTLRWLTTWGMWWTFCQLWPKARPAVTLAAFLFAVYPSFTQQSDAVAYHQHWAQYSLYFLSLGSMAAALRARVNQQIRQFWLYTSLGLFAQGLHLSITEFFIGVELLRGLMIWFLLLEGSDIAPKYARTFWMRLKRLALFWALYLLIDLLFVFWRLFLYAGAKNQALLLTEIQSAPLSALLRLLRFAVMDSLYTLVTAWEKVFDLRLFQLSQPSTLFSWLISLAVAGALAFYLSRLYRLWKEAPYDTAWRWQMLLLGGLVMLLGPAPIWAAGRQLVTPLALDVHTDRFSMVGMYGACLAAAVGIDWLAKDWRRKAVLLAVLAGLAAGFQLRTGNEYRWIWISQQRFYWQLFWRAPYLEPGTAVVVETEPLAQQELFSTSSALNFLYPQPQYPQQVAYWVYKLRPRYEDGFPEGFLPGFQTTHRIFEFKSAPGASILVQYAPVKTASCLWVLRPEDRAQPDLSPLMNQAVHLSNLSRISSQERALPPADLFGAEPKRDWCWYFEKADLARQFSDWVQVVSLGDQVRALGYNPLTAPSNSPYEWLPFIEGYLHEKRWDEALELTLLSYQVKKQYGGMLCQLWAPHAASGQVDAAAEIERQLGCVFAR